MFMKAPKFVILYPNVCARDCCKCVCYHVYASVCLGAGPSACLSAHLPVCLNAILTPLP